MPRLCCTPGLVLLAALAGCAPGSTPEQQVRAVVTEAEQAAEERDLDALMDLVSEHYVDAEGRDASGLSRYVRGYLLLHPSIHLLTRVDTVDFPYRDLARVRVTVGSLAREAAPGASFDLAADVEQLDIELQLEDDDWRVVRAQRVR